jgi:hypothetical protein
MPTLYKRKLGTSIDAKKFIYNHGGNCELPISQTQPTLNPINTDKKSLINASKLAYDPITHAMTFQSSDRWQSAKKFAPFSK